MIDNQDKQTQPLDLGPAPKRRGRPAKENALSNAERQRLYRERQKAQRNEKSKNHQVPYDEVTAIAKELGERCQRAEEKRDELYDRIEELLINRDDLIRECKELKKQLAQRNENPADQNDQLKGVWIVESKRPGSRMWKPCGKPETNLKDARQAVDYMQFKSGSGRGEEWRAIRADGLFYWPLWAKKTKAAK